MSLFNDNEINQVSKNIMEHIFATTPCMIDIDLEERTYVAFKSDQFFLDLLGKTGPLDELYRVLFYQTNRDQNARNEEYALFKNDIVFKKEKFQTTINFEVNGVEHTYQMYICQYNSRKSAAFFQEDKDFISAKNYEKEKMDSIQESYLFSMLIDLKENLCINPSVTEISAQRQASDNLCYDDFRMKISNMFMEEDKVLFLRASSPENIINTLEQKVKFHIDLQMMNMMGEYKWSRLNFVRTKNFSRDNPRFIYTVYDIDADMQSLLKQEGITRAVQEQNEQLKDAEKNKSKYIANLTHEVRNPINAIMGLNEVILRDAKEPEIKSYAQDIKVASQVLLNVVNDVLDISKISAGRMQIVPVEYNTVDVVRNVSALIKPRLELKKLDYKVIIKDGVPSRVFGDDMRIMQVLMNLLTNAIKYTDKGSVTFTLEPEKLTDGSVGIRYTIEDTGIGIKEEDISLLFSDFVRLELSRNRNVEGTGLGMGIVNGLLAAMNSKLEVSSVYGQGSKFTFVLAQNIVDSTPVSSSINVKNEDDQENTVKDLSGKNILIVDDMAANLRVFAALIKPYKATVHLANGPIRGLKFIDEFEYDLIFVDHLMPEIDGVEFLKRVRDKGGSYSTTPVIAMTGNYSPTARDEYRSIGFNDYMDKPITLEHLDKILEEYI